MAALLVTGGASSAPPSGAAALCKNGKYSFSQIRSGACSRNRGVAQRLTTGPASGAPLTVGAYYYAWYQAKGQWSLGYARSQLDTPERPALGEYDSRDPAVIARHYEWAHQYGIDVFFCSWRGPNSYDDGTIRRRLLPSPARGRTRIALLYESLDRLVVSRDDRIHLDAAAVARMVNDFDYLARTYFGNPGYYRIKRRPVVVVYASRILRGDVAAAIGAVRRHLLTKYGVDPYLIGDEVDPDAPPNPSRIGLFDAITGYTLYSQLQSAGWPAQTGFVQAAGSTMRRYQRVAKREGVAFVPDSMPGYDDRGTRPQENHHVLPRPLGPRSAQDSLFTATLALAGTLLDPTLRLMTVTSWNEWHEDTQIEPTAPGPPPATGPNKVTQGYPFKPYGLSLLQRLRQFKRKWEHARSRPTHPRQLPTSQH